MALIIQFYFNDTGLLMLVVGLGLFGCTALGGAVIRISAYDLEPGG